jgi:NTE family protein
MAEPLTHRPDVLVLAAGGTLGEAWMRGLLDGAGRATGIDFRDCEYFVGTSAGSIVAAFLAAGREPDSGPEARAANEWGSKAGEANGAPGGIPVGAPEGGERGPLKSAVGRIGMTAAAPFATLALAGTAPGGAVARAAALAAVPRGKRSLGGLARLVEQSGASFDGRLRIAAVDRRSGKRVVFGAPGAPGASVAQAVLASCSIPWVFKPVTIDGREYVDGGVWSPTNLDATPARRGIEVLCLNPTAASRPLSSVSNAAALAESLALRARGARVRTIRPDGGAAEAMGNNLMDRRRAPEALAAGYAQGLALAG